MRVENTFRLKRSALLAAGLLAAAVSGLAQQQTKQQDAKQQTGQSSAPSTAQKFPFPGEDAGAGASGAAQGSTPQSSSSANGSTAGAAKDSTAQRFPFPSEAPDAPAAEPAAAATPTKSASDDPAWSSSSSSAASSMPEGDEAADPALNDEGSSGESAPTPTRYRRKQPPKAAELTPEQRESEDLDVAKTYADLGNYSAAYLRAKDAVGLKPEDPFAQFALAESAQKLNKPDEAREHYAQVLKLDPDPKQKKAAQKALAELGKNGK